MVVKCLDVGVEFVKEGVGCLKVNGVGFLEVYRGQLSL